MPNIFVWISAELYAADIAVHLTAVAKKNERLRRTTKVLLMPLLALTFLLAWLSVTAAALPVLVIAGLLMGFAGDTALLSHHSRIGLPLGLASFAAGHVLYTIQIWKAAHLPAWWVILVLVLAYGACVARMYVKLFPYLPKAFRIPALSYMMLISTLSLSAASAAIASFSIGAGLLLLGTLLFMLSDGILSFEMFRSETKSSHLRVMVPYLAGQTLIASGFLLSLA